MTYVVSMTGAILTGGRSSRFGRNKALEVVRGVPVIQRILDSLGMHTEEVFIVTAPAHVSTYKGLGARIITDIFPGKGPIAGLHTALVHSRSNWVLLCACDLPFIQHDIIRVLIDACFTTSAQAVVPEGPSGPEPLFACYHKDILREVERRLAQERLSMKDLLKSISHKILDLTKIFSLEFIELAFSNINTKKDLEKALFLYDKWHERHGEHHFCHADEHKEKV